MFARFKAAKCNVQLKQCASRIQLLQNQREMRVLQMKREIAELLRAGKETRAIVQVEQKLREEATMAAYGVIAASCHTLCAQMPMIEGNKKCPHDLKREIATIIFAAPRCGDLPELQQLQAMFTAKFGKEFAASASELRPDCGVDKRVIDALTLRAPSGEASLQALAAIAAEHHVDWTPTMRQQDGAEAPPHARGGAFGSPPRANSRPAFTLPETSPAATPIPLPLFQSHTRKPLSIGPDSSPHLGPAAHNMGKPEVYRPPPSPDTPLRPRTGEDPFARRGSGASARGPAAGDPLVSSSEGSPRFPAPAGEERPRFYSGDARSPRAWEENPDAAVAALAVTAEQMTYLAQAVVASHARERESRLLEKLRAERGSGQGGDHPTADESPNAARAQRREEEHARENVNGKLIAHLGENDGDNKRHWNGESSQQRWPRNAEQFDNVHGGGNGVSEGAWGRVAPLGGDMSGAGRGMQVRSPQQRPGAAHAPRPTSPDSLAARSSEEHRGSSEDEDGPPAREVGASGDGKLDRLRPSERETRTRKSSGETRGWSEGGEQPAAVLAKGAPAAAGQPGHVSPQDKKHSAAVARPHTVERPGRGPLPPPPKLHVERGRFFKTTAPSTASDPFDLPPASPEPETDDLAARMRALRFKR